MRRALVLAVVALVPSFAAAQSTAARDQSPSLPPIGLPLPPIAPPLPPIGLPLPSIGLPPATTTVHPVAKAPRFAPHQRGRRGKGGGVFAVPSVIYVVPPYSWPVEHTHVSTSGRYAAPRTEPAPPDPPATGVLQLELGSAPGDAQVFVDGAFTGALSELGQALALEPGRHRLEIQAPGHEPLTFDVQIVVGRTITYRESLRPLPPAASPAPQPAAPSTFYYIPGCYLGDVPPEQVTLPANCDLSRLIVRKPAP